MTRTSPSARQRSEAPTASELLSDAITVLARRWRLVAMLILVTTITGYALSARQPKSYVAQAQVLIASDGQLQGLVLGTNAGQQPDLERVANTDLALVKLEPVAVRVRDELRLPMSPAALLSEVTAEYEGNSNLVGISVTDARPERAADIANAFALAYQASRRDATRATFMAALHSARSRLLKLGPVQVQSPFGKLLSDSINRLQIAAVVDPGGVKIAQTAVAPRDAANTRPIVTGFIGFIVGCLLAAAVLMLLERLDDRLHDEQSAERLFGASGLWVSSLRMRRGARGKAREQRAFARLAARLMRSTTNHAPTTLMVAAPTELPLGAHLTLGLAKALANLGRRVIVVDANLARPGIGGSSFDGCPGLVALVAGESILQSELRRLYHGADNGRGHVELLPVGSPDRAAATVLSSDALRDVVDEAGRLADVVLVLGPPLLCGAEPLTLVPVADAVLVVAKIGETTVRESLESIELLQELDARVLGAVVVQADRWQERRAEVFDTLPAETRASMPMLRADAAGVRRN